jgi:hypothetical protein
LKGRINRNIEPTIQNRLRIKPIAKRLIDETSFEDEGGPMLRIGSRSNIDWQSDPLGRGLDAVDSDLCESDPWGIAVTRQWSYRIFDNLDLD